MKNIPLSAATITAVAVLIVLAVLLLPTPVPNPLVESTPAPKTDSTVYSKNLDSGLSIVAGKFDVSSDAEERQATLLADSPSMVAPAMSETKEQALGTIDAAMSTYSEEGLPILTPYLGHEDPDIRSATIEAMKQLAVPEAAKVLRRAAKSAKNDRERIDMLQAAEFLELPRLPLSEVRKLLKVDAINSSATSGSSAPSAP